MKIVGEIVLQANPGTASNPDDWRAVVGAICDAMRLAIANAKEKAYNETIDLHRKEQADRQSVAPVGATYPRREPRA